MTSPAAVSPLQVEDVIATAELEVRAPRIPDYRSQSEALAELAETLAGKPSLIFQRLVEAALSLTAADSAGLSLQEGVDGPDPHFRWVATAGEFHRYVGGRLPRFFSPCATVVGCNTAMLMVDAVRAFTYIAELDMPCHEILLAPFHEDGVPVGTLWVVHHTTKRHFDVEDRRILINLSRFAGIAVKVSAAMDAMRGAMKELREKGSDGAAARSGHRSGEATV